MARREMQKKEDYGTQLQETTLRTKVAKREAGREDQVKSSLAIEHGDWTKRKKEANLVGGFLILGGLQKRNKGTPKSYRKGCKISLNSS